MSDVVDCGFYTGADRPKPVTVVEAGFVAVAPSPVPVPAAAEDKAETQPEPDASDVPAAAKKRG